MVDFFYKTLAVLIWAFGMAAILENRENLSNAFGEWGFFVTIAIWCLVAIPSLKKEGLHWLNK